MYDFRIYGKNAKNYNYKSFILHFFNKGRIWKKSNICTFPQSKPPKVHYTISENGDLYYFKVLPKGNYTSLTPLKYSARKMTWSQKKEIKLFFGIGKIQSINICSEKFHFFFLNNTTKKLNYFNTNINFTNLSKPILLFSNEDIDILSSTIKNNHIEVLGVLTNKADMLF